MEQQGRVGWADLRNLAMLALLVVGVRSWQLTHTEVASRDSVSYVRIAWQLEHQSWREVLPRGPQHPGYPLAVLGVSLPVRHFLPDDLPLAWQLSAQLASALASLLLLVPMYYLGRELFDRRVAFWACALFQCMPTSGKVMGDGLSDTVFLLFACAGLWLAFVALRRGSWPLFALTGLAGGLAYLTRPEGALVVGATGLVLLGMQALRRSRRPWRSFLLNGSALSLAAAGVMAPYMLVIGGLTVKNTPNLMMNQPRPDADWEDRLRPHTPREQGPHSAGVAVGRVLPAVWWVPGSSDVEDVLHGRKKAGDLKPTARHVWALKALALELGKGFFFVAWMPALLGLGWHCGRFFRVPGAWVILLVCVLLTGLLFRVAEKMGYLSDRHLLLVVLCGCYWAAAGTLLLGEKLAAGAARLWPASAGRLWGDARGWSLGLILVLTVAPLPRTLQTLHAERTGFRTMGRWLAQNTLAGDYIEDPFCWASYYAGRVFVEGCSGLPVSKEPGFYVVLENSRNRHAHLVSLQAAVVHTLKEKGSEVVHKEKVRRGQDEAIIEVWRVPGPYCREPTPGLPGQSN